MNADKTFFLIRVYPRSSAALNQPAFSQHRVYVGFPGWQIHRWDGRFGGDQ
jgi:hypothetical protein